MKPLHDMTIVITGASSGIGQATAEAFAREGARLVLAARGAEALAEVAAICNRLGGDAVSVPTDVTDPEAVRQLAEKALSLSGEIDVWFSNVGVGVVGKFQDVPMEVHSQVVRANLLGHMHDAHAVLPIFLRQERGIFINMNSLGAFAPTPYAAAYSAGKFGLRGFTGALRAELAPHRDIHICDIYPTFVDTPGIAHAANYTGRTLSAPPPVYDARRVAAAVLRLARNPRNSVTIGGPARILRIFHVLVPQSALDIGGALMRRSLARASGADISTGNVLGPPEEAGGIDGGLRATHQTRSLAVTATLAACGLALLAAYNFRERK